MMLQYFMKNSGGCCPDSKMKPYTHLSLSSLCLELVNVTTAVDHMEVVYSAAAFVLCFQDATKAFQMCPHSSALSHMFPHDYFEKYIIVKKFCFHCVMHELVIFTLSIVFISTF